MMILTVLSWILWVVFLSLIVLLLLLFCAVLLPPIQYNFRGRWHEGFSFAARMGSKLLRVQFSRSVKEKAHIRLWLAGFPLLNKPLTGKKDYRAKYTKKKKKTAKKFSPRDALPFLDRRFFARIAKTVGKLAKDSAPRVFKVSGVWGFSDPYHTGILAVFRALIPGLAIEPDFTGENHDLKFHLAGRILPIRFLWEGLKLIFSREAWAVIKKVIKNKKAQKKCNRMQAAGV